MIIRLFKSNKPLVYIAFIVFCNLLLLLPYLFMPFQEIELGVNQPSISTIIQHFFIQNKWLYTAVYVIFCVLYATYFNIFLERYKLSGHPSHIPAICFSFFAACLYFFSISLNILLGLGLIIYVFSKAIKNHNEETNLKNTFNAGLWIGLCSLIDFSFLLYALVYLFVISVGKYAKIKKMLLFFIGLLYFPLISQVLLNHLLEYNIGYFPVQNYAQETLGINNILYNSNIPISSSFALLCAIFGTIFSIHLIIKLQKNIGAIKFGQQLFVVIIISNFFTYFIDLQSFQALLAHLCLPFSYGLTLFIFNQKRAWISETVYFILIIGLILTQLEQFNLLNF